jgi:hypothetical protein
MADIGGSVEEATGLVQGGAQPWVHDDQRATHPSRHVGRSSSVTITPSRCAAARSSLTWTASALLNRHPRVRLATQDRVMSAAEELGYRRNSAARALRRTLCDNRCGGRWSAVYRVRFGVRHVAGLTPRSVPTCGGHWSWKRIAGWSLRGAGEHAVAERGAEQSLWLQRRNGPPQDPLAAAGSGAVSWQLPFGRRQRRRVRRRGRKRRGRCSWR